jgi:hypothetical protein
MDGTENKQGWLLADCIVMNRYVNEAEGDPRQRTFINIETPNISVSQLENKSLRLPALLPLQNIPSLSLYALASQTQFFILCLSSPCSMSSDHESISLLCDAHVTALHVVRGDCALRTVLARIMAKPRLATSPTSICVCRVPCLCLQLAFIFPEIRHRSLSCSFAGSLAFHLFTPITGYPSAS